MNNEQMRPSNTGKLISFNLDEARPANPMSILKDLFELLEEYAPAWYTEEHHNRTIAALLNRAS